MKLTQTQLRQIIREEIQRLNERRTFEDQIYDALGNAGFEALGTKRGVVYTNDTGDVVRIKKGNHGGETYFYADVKTANGERHEIDFSGGNRSALSSGMKDIKDIMKASKNDQVTKVQDKVINAIGNAGFEGLATKRGVIYTNDNGDSIQLKRGKYGGEEYVYGVFKGSDGETMELDFSDGSVSSIRSAMKDVKDAVKTAKSQKTSKSDEKTFDQFANVPGFDTMRVKNPQTGRSILVKTALGYGSSHPAWKAALKTVKSAKKKG